MKKLLGSALLLFAFSLNAQAPVAVPIPKEPHHHLILENDYVRVFRVTIPAHNSTLLHQHDVPYIYVALGPADVINAIQGKPEAHLVMADGQVGYSRGGFAHIARTDSGMVFNNVTIELLKSQGEPQNLCSQIVPGGITRFCQRVSADRGKGYSIEPQFETEGIKLDFVRLDPKAKKVGLLPQTNSLLIILNASKVGVEEEGGPVKVLAGGEVTWIAAGSHETVSNHSMKACSYLQLNFKESGPRVQR
jgi:hypothetical protein